MTPWIIGTSLIVTSETRHFAPSAAAPSADIRSTTYVGGSPGGMSAAAGGGACATEYVATVNETTPTRLAANRLARRFLRMANAPLSVVLIHHGTATGKASQATPTRGLGVAAEVDAATAYRALPPMTASGNQVALSGNT